MEIIHLRPASAEAGGLWLVNGVRTQLGKSQPDTQQSALKQWLGTQQIEVFHLGERDWLIGRERIAVPSHVEDTEEAAMAIAFPGSQSPALQAMERKLTTYQLGPYDWVIEGQRVGIPRSGPDTEEAARAVLANVSFED
jgi:hypothetical protein